MSIVKILNVKQVQAHSKELRALNSRWKRDAMQIITTDKGVFIDRKAGDRGHWIGQTYNVGEDYTYSYTTSNSGREVMLQDTPIAADNIWLAPAKWD